MPRVATRHVHRLAYRQRFSVVVRMFGCLVLLAGGIVLAAAVAEAANPSAAKTSWLMASIGTALAVCGAVLLCGERGKLIDREHGTVTQWWGIVTPLWHRSRDVRPYRAVVVESCDDAGAPRWRVSLFSDQAQRLELFDLASHEAAQAAARQVAAFLSLTILLPTAAGAEAPTAGTGAAPASDLWTHWRRHRRPLRFLGAALLPVAGVLLLGGLGLAASHEGRGWIGVAIAAPLFASGLWLLCGGRKVEIDRQSVRVWRAWPLPPAVYDLPAFFAVVVATAGVQSGQGEPETCLVGLIDHEQLRLELIGAMPGDEARQTAARLAATTNFPLIDESQPAVPRV